MSRTLLIVALFASTTSLAAVQESSPGSVQRFALIAGANDGGEDRVRLRYAASDALTFAQVMSELGGMRSADQILLEDPNATELRDGFVRLRERLKSAKAIGRRLEVLVYYSGHSDEQGLRLSDELFSYAQLRDELTQLPADVRIAVLDSCSSGAFTRTKGGKRRASFMIDASTDAKGHAILTSSSASEAAQESDRIGASFFTHYLVSGLRGAADVTGDSKVTLTEAYQFAFNETLARTEHTRSGPQHANYDIQLSGTGDLVLTDLRSMSSTLQLDEELQGRLFVRDHLGRLVAEVNKMPGRVIALGLEPGRYIVTVASGDQYSAASIEVTEGDPIHLRSAMLESIEPEDAISRGDVDVPSRLNAQVAEYEESPFCLTLAPGLSTCPRGDKPRRVRFSLSFVAADERIDGLALSLLHSASHGVSGAQLSALGNVTVEELRGLQASGAANVALGEAHGVQLAGAGNVAWDSAELIQGAGGFNLVRGDLRGWQVAGGANVTWGDVRGAQIAPVNWGRNLTGGQVGVVNVGGDVRGGQIGVVNVATGKVNGTQIGVVNYADDYESGIPFGLFNVVRKGQYHLELWSSDVALTNIGFKLGSKNFYTLLAVGHQPELDDKPARLSWQLGIGGNGNIAGPWYLAGDLIAHQLRDIVDDRVRFRKDNEAFLSTLRLMAGYELFDHLAFFAGVSANAHHAFAREDDRGLARGPKIIIKDPDYIGRIWPGFFAGVRL